MHTQYPNFYYFIDNLNIKNIIGFNKKVAIIYRNYQKKPNENEILKFKNYCKKNKNKFLISNYYDLVKKYDLDGLYIPSFNRKKIYSLGKYKHEFLKIGSAHNIKEMRIKESQGVKIIFLSPIFKSKNSNKPLGLYGYNLLANQTTLPTLALGGIKAENKKLLKLINCKGFAGISYFEKSKQNEF